MQLPHSQSNYETISVHSATQVRFYTSVDPGSYVPPHWHEALEIVYLQKGTLDFTIENSKRTLQPGQCVLVNPNVIHSTKCASPNTAIVFQMPVKFLETVVPDIRQRRFNLDAGAALQGTSLDSLKETLEAMQNLNDTRPEGYILRFNSLLFDLLYRLCRDYSIRVIHTNFSQKSEALKRLSSVLDYAALHYTDNISIETISRVAMLQPNYFCRFFKKIMGVTFLEYLNELRLSHILHDLILTDMNITEITAKHGFTNGRAFRSMFYEQFHTTPFHFRKALRQKAKKTPGEHGD